MYVFLIYKCSFTLEHVIDVCPYFFVWVTVDMHLYVSIYVPFATTAKTFAFFTKWRQEVISRPVLPMDDFQVFVPESPIFVDGSCFHHSWAPLRSAAAAVVSKCGCSKAYLLLGLDQTSQRAEILIFAVIAALWYCAWNITVYSDCANVVNIVRFLQRSGFSNGCITNLDNRDLRVLFNSVANQRGQSFTTYKVKAHCSKHDLYQDPCLTEGHSCAGKFAKDTA